MATIEKIIQRPDGRIGVWTGPKTEIEFNDLAHLRVWSAGQPLDIDDATIKGILVQSTQAAKQIADVVTDKPVSLDMTTAISDAIAVAEVAVDPVLDPTPVKVVK